MPAVTNPPAWANYPYRNFMNWSQSVAAGAASTTFILYLGLAEVGGITLRQIHVVSDKAVAVSGSAYYTFKPFINTVKDGVVTTRYLDTVRGTNSHALTIGAPYRIHTNEFIDETLPVGAVVGVEIIDTASPTAAQLSFMASLTSTP